MTRIVIGGLATCWLVVGFSAWRSRRRDVARRMPRRWHRAVSTLQGWSGPARGGPPAAATWCRPFVQPTMAPAPELPRQRQNATPETAGV